MASHSNISDPWRNESRWREILAVKKLEAEIVVLGMERDHYRDNLDSIFNRIAAGNTADLHYADGSEITIQAVPPSGDVDGEAGQ